MSSCSALLAVALTLAGCASLRPCRSPGGGDLGGWMVDAGDTFGVHHRCKSGDHHFVLQLLAEQNAEGRVTRWDDLADLSVRVHRGEYLMFGFECGSEPGRSGDVIAVFSDDTDRPVRAWRIDTVTRQFRVISPRTVTCELLDV